MVGTVSRIMCRSAPPEGRGHPAQFPFPCCCSPLYSVRQHWDGEGLDLAPGLDSTSLAMVRLRISMLGGVVNLLQIHAELRLAAVAASAATLLLTLQPARALISNCMQWTFHPLDVHLAPRSVYLVRKPGSAIFMGNFIRNFNFIGSFL